MRHPQQSVHAGGGAEPAWGQRDTGGAGLRLAGLHILVVLPSRWGTVSCGGGANGHQLPKPSLLESGGKGYSTVPLSPVGKRSEVTG